MNDPDNIDSPLPVATGFDSLLNLAHTDPTIIAVILLGSRGKGFGTAHSDYDVLIVTTDEDVARINAQFAELPPEIDWRSMTLAEFEGYAGWGSAAAWDRYSFANASVLVDKTGEVGPIVAAKGRIPDRERDTYVREMLDAYINGTYRSLKCLRRGDMLGARLEASEAVGYGLTTIFGLEGRHRPYFGYLAPELSAYPLSALPIAGDELLGMIEAILDADAGAQQRLLRTVAELCHQAGYGDVIEGWGEKWGWMLSFRRSDSA